MKTNNERAVIYGMSNAEYHALPAIGNSGLSAMALSPAHYHALYLAEDRPARIETDAFSAGTLAHCQILEPAATFERYAIKPDDLDMRTKAGKEWAAEVQAGRIVISNEQMRTAMAQRDALRSIPEIAKLMNKGAAEVSAFWTESGVECKCRPDWIAPQDDGSVILMDVKTARDATPEGFGRAMAQYGYHRQAAWYSRGFEAASGLKVSAFVFAVVPSAYPFVAGAYVLDDESMQQGQDECASLLQLYAECKQSNNWPGHGSGFQLVTLPAWAKQKQEIEVAYV